MSTEPLPGLPFTIDGLDAALAKIKRIAEDFRSRYPMLTSAPDEFLGAVLPGLEAALGDPDYALKVAARAWAGVLAKESGYGKHHAGLS